METLDKTPSHENSTEKKDNVCFILYRVIFVILIVLFIMAVRYLSPKAYREIKYYYDNYVSVNITADYFLSEE